MKVRHYLFIIIVAATFSLFACEKKSSGQQKKQSERIVNVIEKPDVVKLFYSGHVGPLNIDSVLSPEEGVVEKVKFSYGQKVKKNQLLLVMSSQKMQQDFHDAITNFLKAKDSYLNSKVSFEGAKELFKEQIISRQEFTNEKSQYENNQLSFVDARYKLEQTISKIPGVSEKLEKLTLQNLDQITSLFKKKFNNIEIFATSEGIVLFPTKEAKNSEDGQKEMTPGAQVKKGQMLVAIGDMTGLSIELAVSETDINRLKSGDKVIVTFPGVTGTKLNGEISMVAIQAKRNGSQQGANFPVKVIVKKITSAQRAKIRVGMSARVEVDKASSPKLMVPIGAVSTKDGKRIVTIVKDNGGREERVVTTGRTTMKDIVITNGLKSGEKVIVHD